MNGIRVRVRVRCRTHRWTQVANGNIERGPTLTCGGPLHVLDIARLPVGVNIKNLHFEQAITTCQPHDTPHLHLGLLGAGWGRGVPRLLLVLVLALVRRGSDTLGIAIGMRIGLGIQV